MLNKVTLSMPVGDYCNIKANLGGLPITDVNRLATLGDLLTSD